MAIQVTCGKCHTRFSVSDKFAGKKGPCPKCKSEIEIPTAEEQVVVHAPETFGPKDSKGQNILKPLERSETKLGPIQYVIIGGAFVFSIVIALAIRFAEIEPDASSMWVILGVGAFFLAPVLAFGGYTFLRDQELEPYRGSELWIRVVICGAGFALLWIVFPLVEFTVGGYEFAPLMIGVAVMMAVGGGISLASLELDYLLGVVHYGLYFGAGLGLRWLAGMDVFPTS